MKPARDDVPKIRRITRDSFIALRAQRADDESNPRFEAAVWHVFVEGGEPIGPVTADQIARGIRAGRVPVDASVRHENDLFWKDLLDAPELVSALNAVSTETEPPPPSGPTPDLLVKEFMIWSEGSDALGPVSADQSARGIRAGKVPSDSSIQRLGDLFATDVLDEPLVIAALKHASE